MEPSLKRFYDNNFIPEHIRLVLGLHGVIYLRDLSDFGLEDIQEIEQNIQSGGYGDKVDFKSKVNRLKYLGMDIVEIEKFHFTSIDKKRLKAIGASANAALASLIQKEARKSSEPSSGASVESGASK